MTVPEVSVLIPTYRRPLLLRQAIKSVLAQRGVEFELVVGDDGNQGGQVVAEFGDARIRYVAHPQRLGLAGNWNFLLEAARGRYVGLLMDDDQYLPDFLATSAAALEANADVGLVFANHLFESDGRLWQRPSLIAPGTHRDFALTIIERNPVAICASLIRRDALQQVGPLPDTGAADLVLFGRLADEGWAFHYVDRPLMVYRVHQDAYSASRGFRNDVVQAWEALRFRDPIAEAARRRRLAGALVSRAALHVQLGDRAKGQEDLAAARQLRGARSAQAGLLQAAAIVPGAGRPAHAAKRAVGRGLRAMLNVARWFGR